MSALERLVAACALAVAAALGLHARDLSGTPPFEVRVPLARRPQIEFRGVNLAFDTNAGYLLVRAARAAPTSSRVADFSVGPPRMLALRDAHAAMVSSRSVITVRACDAELRDDELVLLQAEFKQGQEPRQTRDVTIDLSSGAFRRR